MKGFFDTLNGKEAELMTARTNLMNEKNARARLFWDELELQDKLIAFEAGVSGPQCGRNATMVRQDKSKCYTDANLSSAASSSGTALTLGADTLFTDKNATVAACEAWCLMAGDGVCKSV